MNARAESSRSELLAKLRSASLGADTSIWTVLSDELKLSDALCCEWLSVPHLESYQLQLQDPLRPVRFSLVTRWEVAP